MEIAIIGTGHIGSGLARAWVRAGHHVTCGVRDTQDPSHAALRDVGVHVAPVEEAVRAAVVTLAVPFGAVPAIARMRPDWTGTVVIDCTNAVGPGFTPLVGHTDSSAEINARLLPGARLVKSFTAQGAENVANPVYGNERATNFYCGDDADAKAIVRQLVTDVGFEPLDLGGLPMARVLEPMTFVWFAASRALGTRDVAFTMLRRR